MIQCGWVLPKGVRIVRGILEADYHKGSLPQNLKLYCVCLFPTIS